jgi:hypothetical protein
MNRVTTEWILSVENNPSPVFMTATTEYKIVDVKYLKPRSWRFYSSSDTYILAVLNDTVRIQSDPEFVIRFPDTINDFLRKNGLIVR